MSTMNSFYWRYEKVLSRTTMQSMLFCSINDNDFHMVYEEKEPDEINDWQYPSLFLFLLQNVLLILSASNFSNLSYVISRFVMCLGSIRLDHYTRSIYTSYFHGQNSCSVHFLVYWFVIHLWYVSRTHKGFNFIFSLYTDNDWISIWHVHFSFAKTLLTWRLKMNKKKKHYFKTER